MGRFGSREGEGVKPVHKDGSPSPYTVGTWTHLNSCQPLLCCPRQINALNKSFANIEHFPFSRQGFTHLSFYPFSSRTVCESRQHVRGIIKCPNRFQVWHLAPYQLADIKRRRQRLKDIYSRSCWDPDQSGPRAGDTQILKCGNMEIPGV